MPPPANPPSQAASKTPISYSDLKNHKKVNKDIIKKLHLRLIVSAIQKMQYMKINNIPLNWIYTSIYICIRIECP